MSAEELLKMTEKISSAVTDTQAIRDKIFEEFNAATTSDQRVALLGMFKATMDVAESWHAKHGTEEQLAAFREARADDYTKLLVQESTHDGTLEGKVSPEAFMAVTNREIAAGRMTPKDPIRQAAVMAAAAMALPSDAELLAQEAARKRADASIENLTNELRSAKTFDLPGARAKIGKVFDVAVTIDQYGKVLAIFKAIMDEGERHLTSRGDLAELLEDFRKARVQDYKVFIAQECTLGLHSPGGGQISVDMLMAVTNREIAAGRMNEDHSMRKIAVEGAAVPHFSHAQMLADDAKVREEAAQSTVAPTPKTKPGSASVSYALGATLGKKLKGLFRK